LAVKPRFSETRRPVETIKLASGGWIVRLFLLPVEPCKDRMGAPGDLLRHDH
jgi:hypothetical protein